MSRLCAYVECGESLKRRSGEEKANFERRRFCSRRCAGSQQGIDNKTKAMRSQSWEQRTKIDDGSYKLFMGKHGA